MLPLSVLSLLFWPLLEALLVFASPADKALCGSGRSGCTSALQALSGSNIPATCYNTGEVDL